MRKEFLTAKLEPEKAVNPLSWSHCAPCTDSTSLPGGPTTLHSLSVLPPQTQQARPSVQVASELGRHWRGDHAFSGNLTL